MDDSFIHWDGIKRKELPLISEYTPKTWNTFIDSCGGSACVSLHFLKTSSDKRIIYNDIDPGLCNLINCVKDKEKNAQLIADLEQLLSSSNCERLTVWDKLMNTKPEDYTTFEFVARGLMAILGIRNSNTPQFEKGTTNLSVKKPKDYRSLHDKAQNLEVTNRDCLDILDECKDDETIFIYIDPPYLQMGNTCKDFYNFSSIDLLNGIAERLPRLKCKVMLNVDFCGHTYLTFQPWIKKIYPVKFSRQRKNDKFYKNYNCIITNYDCFCDSNN